MAEQGLKSKTVIGVTWTALDTILRYGITFVVGIVLARLLTPDEYGLIGILTIFIELFNITFKQRAVGVTVTPLGGVTLFRHKFPCIAVNS